MHPTSNTSTVLYYWKGKNRLGKKLQGKVIAENEVDLALRLKQQGILVLKIRVAQPVFYHYWNAFQQWNSAHQKLRSSDLTAILRQLSLLLSANIPLIQALDVIGQNDHPIPEKMRQILKNCQAQIQAGHPLSQALEHYPQYFSPLFCRWIEAGERSGTLDVLLEYWVNHQEKNEMIRQKIKKALTYPLFIIGTTILVAIILLINVVPEFEKLFHQFHAELPALTRYVLKISYGIQHFGLPIGIVSVGIMSGLWWMRRYFFSLSYGWDYIILNIPFSGKLIQEASMARFTRALSIMLSAGFPLSEALQWTSSAVIQNGVFIRQINALKKAIISGITLNHAMSESALFPALLKQMTAIGEASGTLDQTLSKTADFYEKKIMNTMDNLGQLLEPILMVVLGILAGGFILAMYLPIFQMGELF